MRKEALLTVKSLLSVLLREHSLRPSSTQQDVILHESETWLMLLSTVEGFINDKDILGTINNRGVDTNKLQRHLANTRQWITYWRALATNQKLTEQEYQRYIRYTDMILTKTSETLDDLLKQEPVYRAQPQSWLRNAAAGLLITIAGYTGLGTNAYAQDVADTGPAKSPPTIEKKEEKKDYAKELEDKLKEIKIEEGKDSGSYNSLGVEAIKKGDRFLALRYFEEQIKVDDKASNGFSNAAMQYLLLGQGMKSADMENAKFYFQCGIRRSERALELTLDRYNAKPTTLLKAFVCAEYAKLALLNFELGNTDAAKVLLNKSKVYGVTPKYVEEGLKSLK
jgi:tetratricopeptide (TPR) repeat protein